MARDGRPGRKGNENAANTSWLRLAGVLWRGWIAGHRSAASPLHAERRDAVSAGASAATVVVHLQSQSVRGKENDRLLQVLWRGFGSCHRHNGRHDHLSTTRTAPVSYTHLLIPYEHRSMRSRGAADARMATGRGRPGRGEGRPTQCGHPATVLHHISMGYGSFFVPPNQGPARHTTYGGANRPSAIGEHALPGRRWRRLT